MAKQTITAFFDSREYANNAALMLRQAGVPDSDVRVSPAASDASTYAETSGTEGKGFWASLEDMFGGSEDHDTYAEGLRRGGIMVVASVAEAKVDDAIRILDQHGSVDMSERETTWRGEGWTGAASTGSAALAGATSTLGMTSTGTTGRAGLSDADARTTLAAKPAVAPLATSSNGNEDVLQVVEEQLSVGKRAVNRGKVRIHSYVVETPVTETVSLRDETVTVDRRPVDRPLGAAELGIDAFKDRTIEMEETDEEAVVAKSARVVEEIGIRKDVSDRTQTINDSVRSTKVDIDDGRTAGLKTGAVGGFGTRIIKDMEVVGLDGTHVGIIDHVDGATIKLKKNDPASGGQHHLIPVDWVTSVDSKVTLKTSAADAKSRWTAA